MKRKMFLWGALVSVLFVPHVLAECTSNPENAKTKIEHTESEAEYCTKVNEAFTHAKTGDKIILLTDVNVADLSDGTSILATNASAISLIFDLSGKRITANGENATFYVDGGIKLEIIDSSMEKSGKIENINGYNAIIVKKGTLTLSGGNYVVTNFGDKNIGTIQVGSSKGEYKSATADLIVKDGVNIEGSSGIAIFGDNKNVTIDGGQIAVNNFALSGHGSSTINSTIKINNGDLISNENAAIYHPQTGTLTIEGGNITGAVGIVARQGTINVKGGTITANGTLGEVIVTGDAKDAEGNPINIPSGTGIVVDNSDKGKYGETKVTVDMGIFKTNDVGVKTLKEPVDEEKSSEIIVNGGNFNHPLKANYIASNKKQSAAGAVAEEDKIHNIELSEEIANGKIEVATDAFENEEVTVTINPNEGYELDELIIRKKDGDKDIIELVDGKFKMPNSDVTISATFKIMPTGNKEENKPTVDNPDTGTNMPIIAFLGMLSGGVTLFVLGKKGNKLS